MNGLDDKFLNIAGFSYRDIIGQDRWEPFTPIFTSLAVVGATTYAGRFRTVGRQCFFQITLLAATSIASTAGTTYLALPVTAKGIAGEASMTNMTTNIAVGDCVIRPDLGICVLPTQIASGNTFSIAGWYEV